MHCSSWRSISDCRWRYEPIQIGLVLPEGASNDLFVQPLLHLNNRLVLVSVGKQLRAHKSRRKYRWFLLIPHAPRYNLWVVLSNWLTNERLYSNLETATRNPVRTDVPREHHVGIKLACFVAISIRHISPDIGMIAQKRWQQLDRSGCLSSYPSIRCFI